MFIHFAILIAQGGESTICKSVAHVGSPANGNATVMACSKLINTIIFQCRSRPSR